MQEIEGPTADAIRNAVRGNARLDLEALPSAALLAAYESSCIMQEITREQLQAAQHADNAAAQRQQALFWACAKRKLPGWE